MPDRRVILVICDGLRADMVREAFCPNICALKKKGAWFDRHHSVFPSVTRVASSSIATGCRPGRHGLHGNTMVLVNATGPTVHDVGRPNFPKLMRQATGGTLRVPTLAQRVATRGGSMVMSNVSPGGAYFQDPDGYGFVFHRAGSYRPGLKLIAADGQLDVSHDGAGDLEMTRRFCGQALLAHNPGLSVLWLCEPDHTGHHSLLGSPPHLDAIRSADRCVAEVAGTVDALRASGENVLCLVGSDHGQETVREAIELDRVLVQAGLKRSLESNDVLIAPQGTSALIYLNRTETERLERLRTFLSGQPWVDKVMAGEDLEQSGLPAQFGLSLAVSMAKSPEANEFGIAGLTDYVALANKKEAGAVSQHGGLGPYEQRPFLIAWGAGFQAGQIRDHESRLTDIAPTILYFLGLPWSDMDGRPLQEVSASI